MSTFYEFIWVILIILGGNFGIPVGVAPGPEDPVITNVAPENCWFYAGWSGTVPVNKDANPTEKWLSQPKASQLIPKVQRAIRIMLDDANIETDDGLSDLNSVLVEVIEFMITEPGCFFVERPNPEDLANNTLRLNGGAVFNIKANRDSVTKKFSECFELVTKLQNERGAQGSPVIAHSIGGRDFIILPNAINAVPVHFLIEGDYFIIGVGASSTNDILKRMKGKPAKWLTDLKGRLKVDRLSSVGYVDTLVSFNVFTRLPWWLGYREVENLVNEIESIAWVSGLDDAGFLTRTEVKIPKDHEGIFKIIDQGSIKQQEVSRIPSGSTAALASKISKEELLKIVTQYASQAGQKDWWADAKSQVLQITGVKLDEELLASVGETFSCHYTLSPQDWHEDWVVTVHIEDEMSFPAIFEQLNTGLERWINESDETMKFRKKKYGIHTFYIVDSPREYYDFAWCLIDDQWLFARKPADLLKHIEGPDANESYADNPYFQSFFEFGDKNDLGSPITMGHLNLTQILEVFRTFVSMILQQDGNIAPDFELKWNDIPPIDELINGAKPIAAAIYKSKEGYQLLQRQTYPGSSPPVTFATIASMAVPFRTSVLATKAKIIRIGKANLAFEKEHGRLVAEHSRSADGTKLLSWRVHLLPYLGHQELYDQFHLDEPWDSEHNKTLIKKIPNVYQHPKRSMSSGKTAFLAPREANSVFVDPSEPTSKSPLGIKIAQIIDGTTHTAMIYEGQTNYVTWWTKPGDPKNTWTATRTTRRPAEFFVLYCDSSAALFNYWDLKSTDMQNLIQRNDGKKVPKPITGWLR